MCFANAVLQLLVHSPPFWNLFKHLGNLKGQRGAEGSKIGGGATPLVDAMVRFLEEFVFREKEPPPTQITQQLLQHATRGKPREDGEEKNENNFVDSFEPTYMYDAMKVKRQLKNLLVRSRAQNAPFCY
jgi:ubiquitin carboxyl-terminal hydrolase 10